MRGLTAKMRPAAATLGRSSAARVLALGLVLLAPLLPPVHLEGEGRSVVYVVDRSLSLSEDDRRAAVDFVDQAFAARSDEALAVVAFDRDAELIVPLGGDLTVHGRARLAQTGGSEPGSDLAGALRLAVAALPRSGERRVVLLTDGRGTSGDAHQAAEAASAQGVIVDVVPLGDGPRQRPVVASVRLAQPQVVAGEPVEATAELRGPAGAEVEVAWSRDGSPLTTTRHLLDAQGRASASVVDPSPIQGLHGYEARLVEVGDRMAEVTDSGRALAVVTDRTRVLVLSSTGERPPLLDGALEEAEVSRRGLDQGQPTAEELTRYDLVVLADVAIARRGEVTLLPGLDDAGQRALMEYVSERAGGLVVLGGVFGLGPEYSGQPIARVLPVEIEDLGEVEDPTVAMAIVLDRSGSMSAWSGGHTKLELAIEAALAAAGTLRNHDRVAIGAVDERTTWYQPLGYLSDLVRRREHIRSMAPGGGGIFVYTALADAYRELEGAREPIRHVVIFSDTADSEEQFSGCPFLPCSPTLPSAVGLARTALGTGVTTSVVGIGGAHDQDTMFLRQLARAGGGRFYVTRQATDLRRIFISETRAATRSSLREEELELEPLTEHPILDGVVLEAMPAITGFVQTGRRPTAETALVTPNGHPVLASWRYGLGTVVAWTSDAGQRWTSGWSDWDGGGQLMGQMLRFALRRQGGHGVEARLALGDGAVEIEVEAPEGAAPPREVELVEVSATGQQQSRTVALERVAPGRWNVQTTDTNDAAFLLARVRDQQGRTLAQAVGHREGEGEMSGDGADLRALTEVVAAGAGELDPMPAATLGGGGPRGERPVSLWPVVLLLAALLVALDLWLRRLGRGQRSAVTQLQSPARPAAAPADREPEDVALAA